VPLGLRTFLFVPKDRRRRLCRPLASARPSSQATVA
jgi:hypothetical protein